MVCVVTVVVTGFPSAPGAVTVCGSISVTVSYGFKF